MSGDKPKHAALPVPYFTPPCSILGVNLFEDSCELPARNPSCVSK
jgi:hypothetical protein